MKRIEWVNGNHMLFESAHKTFNRQVDCISTGNVIGDAQFSWCIRPFTETECNGFTNPQGHLQEFDLKPFRQLIPEDILSYTRDACHGKQAILYVFKHFIKHRRIVDGAVLTTSDYGHPKLIRKWYLGVSSKSNSIIDEAIKYITDYKEGYS